MRNFTHKKENRKQIRCSWSTPCEFDAKERERKKARREKEIQSKKNSIWLGGEA